MLIGMVVLAAASGASLDWLTGSWCTDPGTEQVCETWGTMGSDGVMHGTAKTAGRSTETMTITAAGGTLTFHAEPEGQTPMDFVASGVEGKGVTFLNAEHDYPQRVRYWREGELLLAEIAMADGSKPMHWTYKQIQVRK